MSTCVQIIRPRNGASEARDQADSCNPADARDQANAKDPADASNRAEVWSGRRSELGRGSRTGARVDYLFAWRVVTEDRWNDTGYASCSAG